MKTNQQIAKLFDQVADLLEFQGESSFRFRGYQNAAEVLRGMDGELAEMLEDPQAKLPADLGKTMLERCREVISTGRLKVLDEIARVVPLSVLEILRIPKLGPKKASQLFRELGIATVDQLREACRNQQVQKLPGFGAKSEQTILAGINQLASQPHRWLWATADDLVQRWSGLLANCDFIKQFSFVGDYRRCLESIDRLHLLVVCADSVSFAQWLANNWPHANGQQLDGPKLPVSEFAATVRATPVGEPNQSWLIHSEDAPPLSIEFVDAAHWGTAELMATGNAEHLQQLPELPSAATEADVYRQLNLTWIPPELRCGLDEIQRAQTGSLPLLIELSDIVGDMHSHTDATDGSASLDEMAHAAQSRGLQYLAVTDHSQRVAMARGLDSDRLLSQWRQIDRWNQEHPGNFRLLKGIECDILENGEMDLPDDVLAQADWVIASVHYGQQQPREQITDRILRALKNPHIDIIAHPTGRLINRRPAYQVDMEAVMQAAVEFGKCLELNASPKRLDLNVEHLRQAIRLGIPIVISTDAHSPRGLDAMRYGINQARCAGLTRDQVRNCRPWPEWLGQN